MKNKQLGGKYIPFEINSSLTETKGVADIKFDDCSALEFTEVNRCQGESRLPLSLKISWGKSDHARRADQENTLEYDQAKRTWSLAPPQRVPNARLPPCPDPRCSRDQGLWALGSPAQLSPGARTRSWAPAPSVQPPPVLGIWLNPLI